MLANCLHDLTAIGPGGLGAVATALFMAGLAGGITHCAGMCAPFVIAQVGAGAGRRGGGTLTRLRGAALLPYHAGRMLGYGMLGALAGATAGAISQLSGLRYVLAGLLLLAAALMLLQASTRLPASWRARIGRWAGGAGLPRFGLADRLAARIGPLLGRPEGWNGVLLGLLLSALPCGLLYAALAAAAATGSALAGGIAMLAFTLGTVPALLGVGLLGRLFLRRSGEALRLAGALLFLLNGVVLAAMAVRVVA